MTSIREHVWLAAPASDVWATVGDPGAVASWAPSIESSTLDGDRRTLVLKRGGEVVETIRTLDDELRRLQYSVSSGLPVSGHLGTVDVIETGARSCLVVYSTDVEPESIAPAIRRSLQASTAALGELYGYCSQPFVCVK